MLSYRELVTGLRELGLGPRGRAIAHISLPALGPIAGGVDTVLGSLLANCEILLVPSFTFQTMVTPSYGPPENGLTYGGDLDHNLQAEFFHADLPPDPAFIEVFDALRSRPGARRSGHPILSFAGIGADEGIQSQTLDNPLAPIQWLAEQDGDVLLLGATHTSNIGLHFAERLSGRKLFLRWALTGGGIVACSSFPGCSDGFDAIQPHLAGIARLARIGAVEAQLIPLRDLTHVAVSWMRHDPRALLCDRLACERCADVRAAVRVTS
jgi:aminoglycoside 3-N-acetyltransferase